MSNEIIKDEIDSGNVEILNAYQFVSQNKIYTDAEISKILMFKNSACVLHKEVLDGEVHVSGKVVSKIVFLGVDGMAHSGDAEMEFNEVIENSKIKQGDSVCIKAVVVDSNLENVSAGEVVLSATVELQTKLTDLQKISYVTGGGDGLYVLEENFEGQFLISSGKQNFDIEIEQGVRENATQILFSSSCLKLKNIKAKNGIAQIDGTVFYNLIFSDESGVKVLNDESLFSEEVLIENADENSNVFANLNVIETTPEILENKIILKNKVEICFDVYKSCKLNFAYDAFSETNEVNLNVVSALQNRFAYNFSENAEVVGNISVKDENFEIRRVIGTVPKEVLIFNTQVEDGFISVEGSANFTAIYEDVDDVVSSVDIEIPFVNKFRSDDMSARAQISAQACIVDVKSKIRKANEIEIGAGISFCFNVFEQNEFAYVSDIEIGEEKPVDDASLVIYTVKKGESLFDVAKKLSIGISKIKEQNPTLEDAVDEGSQIVVYKQKTID